MYLEKNGVKLYYEVRGEGEPLLLIHGMCVDAWFYENAAEFLKKKYQVITFDRRGNSRSICEEGADFSAEAQSEDVRALLDHLGIEQVTMAGASAGTVVGIDFMQKYPERVKQFFMYEGPFLALINDREEVSGFIDKIHDRLARRKFAGALLEFAKSIASYDTRGPKKPDDVAMREMMNMEHALVNEFDVFISYVPDFEKIRTFADRITMAVGEKSGNTIYVQAAEEFARLAGCDFLHFPGYHNMPCDLPKEYAICLLGTLELK